MPTPLDLDVAALTGILTALGVGSIATKLIESVAAHFSGAHDRETARVQRIIDARDAAERDRDRADEQRRAAVEHAHRLRLQLLDAGLTPPPIPLAAADEKEGPK